MSGSPQPVKKVTIGWHELVLKLGDRFVSRAEATWIFPTGRRGSFLRPVKKADLIVHLHCDQHSVTIAEGRIILLTGSQWKGQLYSRGAAEKEEAEGARRCSGGGGGTPHPTWNADFNVIVNGSFNGFCDPI
eukprot:gene17503-biopygen2948